MTGYEELYHVVGWHKEGSSHYTQAEDYGFRYKEDAIKLLEDVLEGLPVGDYVSLTKRRLVDLTIGEE